MRKLLSAVVDFLVCLCGFILSREEGRSAIILLVGACIGIALVCLNGCNPQTIQSQQKIEKKLAQAQAEPFDGGSTRKAYKRILK